MFSNIKVKLQKYIAISQATWVNGFAYPVSFSMWRFRQLIQTFISLSLWVSIYANQSSLFGYQKNQMLTYIFVANIVNYFILSSRTIDVVNVINSGDLSLYLVMPINFFTYWFSRDTADKIQNILFSVGELTLLYLFFRPPFYLPSHLLSYFVVAAGVIAGIFLYFFINMIFGFIGFWSPDAWAPRFLFFMIMSFAAGTLFPLDVFPKTFVTIITYTPFPYLTFFQAKLFLEQLSGADTLRGFIVMGAWIAIMWLLARALWHKGIRGYGSEGH
jgi:ABC-2 type transport system permease protein